MGNQFLKFSYKEWLHIWRDRKTLFILFIMPLVQILLFGFALSNEVRNADIGVLDPSRDAFSTMMTERFDASRYFTIRKKFSNINEVQKAFEDGDVKMAVIFENGAEDRLHAQNKATIQLIADATDPNTATTLVMYANSIIGAYQKELINQDLPYTISPQVRMLYNPQLKASYNFVPGVMAMILLLVCTMMTSISIVREKESGTMELLLASPLPPLLILVAKAVPYLLVSAVNIISILVLSIYVLDLPVAGSFALLLLTSVLFTITSLCLGLLISTISNTQRTAMMISLVGLFMPTLLLSGFMFPIENMPLPLRLISQVVPARWYFVIVKNVMIKGLGMAYIWKEVAVLAGMTLFFIILAFRSFKLRLA